MMTDEKVVERINNHTQSGAINISFFRLFRIEKDKIHLRNMHHPFERDIYLPVSEITTSINKLKSGDMNYITPLEAVIILELFSKGLHENKKEFLIKRCNSKTDEIFHIFYNLSVPEQNLILKRLGGIK